jgi:excisionase family DNA binding protein
MQMRTEILDSERLTLKHVADLLGVHVATIWRWSLRGVRHRKLRTVFVGGRRFVLKSDLDAFLRGDDSEADSDHDARLLRGEVQSVGSRHHAGQPRGDAIEAELKEEGL